MIARRRPIPSKVRLLAGGLLLAAAFAALGVAVSGRLERLAYRVTLRSRSPETPDVPVSAGVACFLQVDDRVRAGTADPGPGGEY